jgi:tetratricopeptide (TPR) repeat protein
MFPAGPAMKAKPAAIEALVIVSFVAACVAGQVKQGSARPSVATAREEVTFNRDVAPIVFRYCAPCHRPGEAAPFSLLSYEDTAKFARQIAYLTEKRIMPPWLPAPGELKFQGEMRLTDAQIQLIQRWVEAGAPRGNPADLPPAPVFTEGWQLGKPDLILHARKPYLLPAAGTDNYWNFIFPTQLSGTHWVKAVEIRPGEKRVVHHANVLIDRMHSSRKQEKQPGAGFAGMELRIESETFDPDSHLFFWKPGSVPHEEPAGMALRLDPGDDFVLNTHLQPSGKAEEIEPSIGLHFTNQPATKFPMLLELQNDLALDIPAGASDFLVTDDFTLPVDVDLIGIYPHAHYLGKELRATATGPGGTTRTLILIPRWDLNWQAVFYYAQPVFLAKGTTVEMRYVYDNSEANIANPFHPPKRVVGGNHTTDEMAHLWLQVLPRGTPEEQESARRSLQEAMARHDIARNPKDFAAQYNLGAILQGRREIAEALDHYRAAVEIRPSDAIANNALGGALLESGDAQAAVGPLRTAVKTQPDYFPARYNLGNALASLGDFLGAVREFQAAVRLNPGDSMAEANLGGALAEVGQFAAAEVHLEKAVKLDPQNSVALDNLAELKRRRGGGQNP